MEGTGTGMGPSSIPGTTDAAKKEIGPQTEAVPSVPEEADNWKHRSKKMRCGTCMSFVLKPTSAEQLRGHLIGRCRALAPTMKGWPVVFSDDWCGNHKLDEEKI